MKEMFKYALALSILIASISSINPSSAGQINWDKKLEKGYYELSIGNVDQAIKMFQEKVKGHPESAACHTALGLALKKKGRLQEATVEFRAATAAEPTFANAFYELGVMQEANKDYAQALQAFEQYEQFSNDTYKKKTVEDRIRFCKEHI